ncbi:hypothetical protein CN692_24300 [Bacillus sp. AFS002410]|uniref:hypothetical protein n=1 Tax=Bacillus sp. AFS002410 TaxID=2033481 RepID=UPI000BEFB886|nr:hypothetical protein [Bacillus sp. AFS002410]PEJ48230.1 hypothetical protein CN692_24300 [Bacillus sp. AFS002410]
MNKRLKKKINDREKKKKAVYFLQNTIGHYKLYISKKYWNKGDKDKGCILKENGDYLSASYINELGFQYIAVVSNCHNGNLVIMKSWNNKNHLVKFS